jgi:hypothetical protein
MFKQTACVLALSLVAASPAAAATVTRFSVKGSTVEGFLSHFDESCGNNFLSVSASDQVQKDGSGKTATRTYVIATFGFNTCNDTNWFGFAEYPLTVPLDGGTVTLPFDFDIEVAKPDAQDHETLRFAGTVTFTPVGDAEKSRSSTSTQSGGVRITSKMKGTTREAQVSGDVTFGGESFTLDSNTEGSFGNVSRGTIEYVRN